jgi:hypothetical protein
LAVILTLKHPSASVNPDNQASKTEIETKSVLCLIFLSSLLLINTNHLANCSTRCFKARLPLNKWARRKIFLKSSTIHL